MSYYKTQLNRLEHSDQYYKSVEIRDGMGGNTNCLNLCLDSIGDIIEYLEMEQERLKKQLKKENT